MKPLPKSTEEPRTFGDLFLAIRAMYDVRIVERLIPNPDRGRPLRVRFLARTVVNVQYGGKIELEHPVAVKTDHERLLPQVGKSLCRNLDIDPRSVGYR